MTVGITGASGFVGSRVARHLAGGGFTVVTLSRAPAAVSGARVLPSPNAPRPVFADAVRGLDAIVHCAARNNAGSGDAADFTASNVDLSARLAAAAKEEGVGRFLYMSSIRAVAGPGVGILIGDDTRPDPTDAYGRSKLMGERAVLEAAGGDFTPLVLRLPPVHGAGMKGNLALMLRLARLPTPLPFAGLDAPRSLVSVDAAARAVVTLLSARAPARTTYVAGDLRPITPAQIIAALRAGLGRTAGLFAVPESLLRTAAHLVGQRGSWANLVAAQTVDPTSLLAEGWTPDPDSQSGLRLLAERLREGRGPGSASPQGS